MTRMGKGILAIQKIVKGSMLMHSINQVEIGNHYTRMFALYTLGLSTDRVGSVLDPTRLNPLASGGGAKEPETDRQKNRSVQFRLIVSVDRAGSVAGIKKASKS